jgi:hypothetical protein
MIEIINGIVRGVVVNPSCFLRCQMKLSFKPGQRRARNSRMALSNLLTRLVDNRGESFDHVVCFLGKVAGFGPRPLSIA